MTEATLINHRTASLGYVKMKDDSKPAETLSSLNSWLGQIHQQLSDGQVADGMERLFLGLKQFREHASDTQWESAVTTCRKHPLCDVLLEDPLIRHAYIRPRGYPGDAILLDYIYYGTNVSDGSLLPPDTSQLGREIFNYLMQAPAAVAVRDRRRFIAQQIDRTAQETAEARILSVAAGHLREAEMTHSLASGMVTEMVALDQDGESLRTTETSYPDYPIRTVQAGVVDLIRNNIELDDFDLIYSAGLYDYLSDRIAAKLTSRLFSILKPGGRLVIPHFFPGIRDVGFMEAYLRWDLIYRSESSLRELVSRLPPDSFQSEISFLDNRNIAVLNVRRSV